MSSLRFLHPFFTAMIATTFFVTSSVATRALARPPEPASVGTKAVSAHVHAVPIVTRPLVEAPASLVPPSVTSDVVETPALRRARRHARRLEITGWTLAGLGLAGFAIGAGISANVPTPTCDDSYGYDDFCIAIGGPGLALAATAMFTAPVFLIGIAVGARGTSLRHRLPPASMMSLAPAVSRSFTGLTLRIGF